jgi:hypothetical protein
MKIQGVTVGLPHPSADRNLRDKNGWMILQLLNLAMNFIHCVKKATILKKTGS